MKAPILLVDGNNLLARNQYVFRTAKAADGFPIGGLFGACRSLRAFLGAEPCRGVIVAFDRGVPAFRRQLCPEYKAQRAEKRTAEDEEMRAAYTAQAAIAHQLFLPMGIATASAEGWEADDVIGGLTLDTLSDQELIIFSSDRDYTQLVTSDLRVRMWDCGKNSWVAPDQFFCLKRCLDPKQSDNLDGVPGVGPVRANQVMSAFISSLEEKDYANPDFSREQCRIFLEWAKEQANKDGAIVEKICARIVESAQKVRCNWRCTHMHEIVSECSEEIRVRTSNANRSKFIKQVRRFGMLGILEDLGAFWPPFERLEIVL